MKCIKCGAELLSIDVALHKKLVNRGSKEFMCINCLALHFNTTTKTLNEMADYYKKMGCTLF